MEIKTVANHDYMFIEDKYAICNKFGVPFTPFQNYQHWFNSNTSEEKPIQWWANYYSSQIPNYIEKQKKELSEVFVTKRISHDTGKKNNGYPIIDFIDVFDEEATIKLKSQYESQIKFLETCLGGLYPMRFVKSID